MHTWDIKYLIDLNRQEINSVRLHEEYNKQANIHWPKTKELFDGKWHEGSKDEELSHSIKLSA